MKVWIGAVVVASLLSGCSPPPAHIVDRDMHIPPIDSLAARQSCLRDGIQDGSPEMDKCIRLTSQLVTAGENCLGSSRRVSMDPATAKAFLACLNRRAPEAAAYQQARYLKTHQG
ncbi:hypothetical protein GCM10007874_50900 [Labrys miyagiensis]|uniref:Lipoprotein n=1 Tax=Labrys miyagiensis TaxID=346912 RepID=A0ABQ6CQL2_9HYPH|nr:hypothetical protein [Labrys miyagiensis]GLS22073.1 hypothetical protein GCM10007874_50900 [Labrys miyagiensis]